jgi:beta-glucosidase
VAQLYVGHPDASVVRPLRELRAFAKVHLDAGGSDECRFPVGMRDLAHWDARADVWVAEPGEHLVWAGTSSRDLGQPTTLVLTERWTAPASGQLDAR